MNSLKPVLLFSSLILSSQVTAEADVEFVPFESIGLSTVPRAVSESRQSLVNFRIAATVKSVSDGDTAILSGSGNARFAIRFSDIDTPETAHDEFTPRDCQCKTIPFRPGQPGGKAATDQLKDFLSVGDSVTAECYEVDWYGRLVCHVFKDGLNVNLEMIKSGWGWLPNNSNWIRDPESRAAEAEAKSANRGAWALPEQVSPDIWRRECWGNGNCDGAEN